jgi:hypothetical protein
MSGYGKSAFGGRTDFALVAGQCRLLTRCGSRQPRQNDKTTQANQFLPPGYRRSRASAPACPHVSKPTTQQPQPISQRPDHLNCGIGGTEMRGGGSGATAGAFGTPIWPSICAEPIKAPLAADPAEPPAEPRANAAAGNARTTRIKAIFVAVFDIGSLHLNLLERRSAWTSCRSRCAVGH